MPTNAAELVDELEGLQIMLPCADGWFDEMVWEDNPLLYQLVFLGSLFDLLSLPLFAWRYRRRQRKLRLAAAAQKDKADSQSLGTAKSLTKFVQSDKLDQASSALGSLSVGARITPPKAVCDTPTGRRSDLSPRGDYPQPLGHVPFSSVPGGAGRTGGMSGVGETDVPGGAGGAGGAGSARGGVCRVSPIKPTTADTAPLRPNLPGAIKLPSTATTRARLWKLGAAVRASRRATVCAQSSDGKSFLGIRLGGSSRSGTDFTTLAPTPPPSPPPPPTRSSFTGATLQTFTSLTADGPKHAHAGGVAAEAEQRRSDRALPAISRAAAGAARKAAHPTGTTGTGTALKTQTQAPPGRALQRRRSQGEVDGLDFASVESKDMPGKIRRSSPSIKSVSVQQRLIDWQRRAEDNAAPTAGVMHLRQMLVSTTK